jgi:hypothetical protein
MIDILPLSYTYNTAWHLAEAKVYLPAIILDASDWPNINIATDSNNQSQYIKVTFRSISLTIDLQSRSHNLYG